MYWKNQPSEPDATTITLIAHLGWRWWKARSN